MRKPVQGVRRLLLLVSVFGIGDLIAEKRKDDAINYFLVGCAFVQIVVLGQLGLRYAFESDLFL